MKGSSFLPEKLRDAGSRRKMTHPKTVIYYVSVIDALGGGRGCRLRELTAFNGLNAFKSRETKNLGHD